jgi:7-cyano-7-deazaguanine synthase
MTETRSKGVCVLASGGIESAALVADAASRSDAVYPLYVKNHLRWEEAEIFCLKQFLRNLRADNVKPLTIVDLTMKDLYEQHWSVTGTKVPGSRTPDESVYLPGRNIVFLAKAGCFAALKGLSVVEIGILKGNPFKDSSKAFLDKMSDLLTMGLGADIKIRAPFSKMKKEEVILSYKRAPLELTFSCINPKGIEHCGECNKCHERRRAFSKAGVPDKTKYKSKG